MDVQFFVLRASLVVIGLCFWVTGGYYFARQELIGLTPEERQEIGSRVFWKTFAQALAALGIGSIIAWLLLQR
jgi:hypothetical protein